MRTFRVGQIPTRFVGCERFAFNGAPKKKGFHLAEKPLPWSRQVRR
jgi:hypothetical protein